MPTYDYLCESCGKRFDAWQKMSDDPIAVCPDCAGHVHRVIHATGVLFKGSGFYSTDHRGPSAAAASTSETSSPAAATKTESAPAAATPSTSSTPAATPATTPAVTKAAS
jgi:putative FmdB family regulatory protein